MTRGQLHYAYADLRQKTACGRWASRPLGSKRRIVSITYSAEKVTCPECRKVVTPGDRRRRFSYVPEHGPALIIEARRVEGGWAAVVRGYYVEFFPLGPWDRRWEAWVPGRPEKIASGRTLDLCVSFACREISEKWERLAAQEKR